MRGVVATGLDLGAARDLDPAAVAAAYQAWAPGLQRRGGGPVGRGVRGGPGRGGARGVRGRGPRGAGAAPAADDRGCRARGGRAARRGGEPLAGWAGWRARAHVTSTDQSVS